MIDPFSQKLLPLSKENCLQPSSAQTKTPLPLHTFFFLVLISLGCLSPLKAQQKTLGMVKHRYGSMEKGYVLFAPMAATTTYLIDKCGRKIHQWKSDYLPGVSAYLLNDGSLLRTGVLIDTGYNAPGRGGIIEKIDWDGKVVWSYRILNDSLAQHHDIEPLDNGNVLIIAYHGIPESDAIAKGRYKGTVEASKLWSERILEIKPKGTNDAEIVWQWSLWDHIIQDADIGKPDYNTISNHPELMNINYAPTIGSDWIHLNAIQYNKVLDQIILSCHNTSEIWIIDHSTTTDEAASHAGGKYNRGGDILYRWGNPAVYNKGNASNQKLFKQHDARWIPNGYKDGGDIMVFNNGLGRSPSYSSIEVFTPPTVSSGVYNQTLPYGPSTQKWTYKDSTPTKFYSAFISGAERLSNGNTLVCSGNQGRLFEIGDKNTIVWEYINPVSGYDNILTDGESGYSNDMFRCIYYSDTFSGFKGKFLTPGGPIEKNSYSYSCDLGAPPDKTAPSISALVPTSGSVNVAVNFTLVASFDELIKKGATGEIVLYENDRAREFIQVGKSNVSVVNKSVIIMPDSAFSEQSRIAISISTGAFSDTAGNPMAALDSASWNFRTVNKTGNGSAKEIESGRMVFYPNPAQKIVTLIYQGPEPALQFFNQLGQEIPVIVKSKSGQQITLDLENTGPGVYSVIANGRFVRTLVKI